MIAILYPSSHKRFQQLIQLLGIYLIDLLLVSRLLDILGIVLVQTRGYSLTCIRPTASLRGMSCPGCLRPSPQITRRASLHGRCCRLILNHGRTLFYPFTGHLWWFTGCGKTSVVPNHLKGSCGYLSLHQIAQAREGSSQLLPWNSIFNLIAVKIRSETSTDCSDARLAMKSNRNERRRWDQARDLKRLGKGNSPAGSSSRRSFNSLKALEGLLLWAIKHLVRFPLALCDWTASTSLKIGAWSSMNIAAPTRVTSSDLQVVHPVKEGLLAGGSSRHFLFTVCMKVNPLTRDASSCRASCSTFRYVSKLLQKEMMARSNCFLCANRRVSMTCPGTPIPGWLRVSGASQGQSTVSPRLELGLDQLVKKPQIEWDHEELTPQILSLELPKMLQIFLELKPQM